MISGEDNTRPAATFTLVALWQILRYFSCTSNEASTETTLDQSEAITASIPDEEENSSTNATLDQGEISPEAVFPFLAEETLPVLSLMVPSIDSDSTGSLSMSPDQPIRTSVAQPTAQAALENEASTEATLDQSEASPEAVFPFLAEETPPALFLMVPPIDSNSTESLSMSPDQSIAPVIQPTAQAAREIESPQYYEGSSGKAIPYDIDHFMV